MKGYDPITAPIAEGDFNGPHGELPSESSKEAGENEWAERMHSLVSGANDALSWGLSTKAIGEVAFLIADTALNSMLDVQASYRMEREDHLEASQSYVKAAKEREDWRLRAVEAERTVDDFTRQYTETLERAEKAEAALVKAKENAAFQLERRDVAEARLAELVSRLRAEVAAAEAEEMSWIDKDRIDDLSDEYEGGEHG